MNNMMLNGPDGVWRPAKCDTTGARVVSGGVSGGGGSGTSDTTEVTQLAVKAAVQSIDTKTPTLIAGAVPVSGPVTDTQLRATPVTVAASARQCLGRQTLALSAGVVTTLTVPAGAVAAAIQADGNTVRCTLDGATAPSATVGTRIDDGVIYYVDTALTNVKLLAPVACSAQVVYFDRA